MRRAVFALPVLVAASVLTPGCEVEDSAYVGEKVVEAEAKIIGGTPDTTHKAVVFVFDENQGAACSGTIIHKNGSTAWVLTAAHCEGMDVVAQANDVEDCYQ